MITRPTLEVLVSSKLKFKGRLSLCNANWIEPDSKQCGASSELRIRGICRSSSGTRFWGTRRQWFFTPQLFLHSYALQLLVCILAESTQNLLHTTHYIVHERYPHDRQSSRDNSNFRWCQQFLLTDCVRCSAEPSHSTQSAEQQEKVSSFAMLCQLSLLLPEISSGDFAGTFMWKDNVLFSSLIHVLDYIHRSCSVRVHAHLKHWRVFHASRTQNSMKAEMCRLPKSTSVDFCACVMKMNIEILLVICYICDANNNNCWIIVPLLVLLWIDRQGGKIFKTREREVKIHQKNAIKISGRIWLLYKRFEGAD